MTPQIINSDKKTSLSSVLIIVTSSGHEYCRTAMKTKWYYVLTDLTRFFSHRLLCFLHSSSSYFITITQYKMHIKTRCAKDANKTRNTKILTYMLIKSVYTTGLNNFRSQCVITTLVYNKIHAVEKETFDKNGLVNFKKQRNPHYQT